MQGPILEHLTKEQIESIMMLQVGISVVGDLLDSKFPTLQDELLVFMQEGITFRSSTSSEIPGGLD